MNYHVIIPARFESTRLPGKPLADIHGEPMVVRVARQAELSEAQSVTVAADDARIVRACEQHGVRAILTDKTHPSGSDRLAQASELLALGDDEIVVNVQGDEPLMPPALIDECARTLLTRSGCVMSTAAHPIANADEYASPNVVKVVCDAAGHALYFSRAPIPWWRDGNLQAPTGAQVQIAPAQSDLLQPLRHIGIYAYRVAFLRRFPKLPTVPLERTEQLEQLRVIWHGERIAVHVTGERPGPGVDTPEDLERVRRVLAQWA